MPFGPALLIPRHEHSQLALAPLAAAFVAPRAVAALIPLLNQACPLVGLRHAKRVRKCPNGQLEVIICRVLHQAAAPEAQQPSSDTAACQEAPTQHTPGQSSDTGCSTAAGHKLEPHQLEEGVATIVSDLSLQLHMVQCAAHAPETRLQWAAWNQIWPITWHVPEISKPLPGAVATAEEHGYFSVYMHQALLLAQHHGVANAAIIVDPATGEVVASSHDLSAAHPLQHAIMASIAQSASRDLQLWPEGVHAAAPAAASSGSEPINPATYHACARDVPAISEPSSAAAEEAEGHDAKRLKRSRPAKQGGSSSAPGEGVVDNPCGLQAELTATASGTGSVTQEGPPAGSARLRQYLCTGYDLFSVLEPCVMCAMAMVHSRVRTVVFAHRDTLHGALGGRLKLHAQGSLNHHYRVFHMPPPAEGSGHSLSPECGPVRAFNLQLSTDQLGFSSTKDKPQSPTQFKIGSRLTSSAAGLGQLRGPALERGSSAKPVSTGVPSTQQQPRPRSAARQAAEPGRPISAARPAERRGAAGKPTSLLNQFTPSGASVVERKRPLSATPTPSAAPVRSSSASRISSSSNMRASLHVQGSLQNIPEAKERVRPMSATRRPQPASPHSAAFRVSGGKARVVTVAAPAASTIRPRTATSVSRATTTTAANAAASHSSRSVEAPCSPAAPSPPAAAPPVVPKLSLGIPKLDLGNVLRQREEEQGDQPVYTEEAAVAAAAPAGGSGKAGSKKAGAPSIDQDHYYHYPKMTQQDEAKVQGLLKMVPTQLAKREVKVMFEHMIEARQNCEHMAFRGHRLLDQANFAWQERVDVEKEEKEQLRAALQERVDAEKVEKEQLRVVILEMQAKLDMHAANRSAAAAASSAASSAAAQVQAPVQAPAVADSTPEHDQQATEELASQRDCLMATFGGPESVKGALLDFSEKQPERRRLTDDTLPVAEHA
ncbi:MAG: hypothetical protein WDW38_004192 [Sanguina aurantia]